MPASTYAAERRQFGKAISSFQLVQELLADMSVELEAARLLTWRAALLADSGERHTLESSVAKYYASEVSVRAANAAVQVHGGYGYVDEYPVGKYLRDARVTTLYEGTSQIQKLIIGRALTGESAFTRRRMPNLDGKVAVVTGAGRGIGREHALALARAGAKIVVNDLGASLAGEGADEGPAHDVVREIEALGGEAVADGENVADFAGAKRLIDGAVAAFGRLDILVNNAGILRDRMLVNMEEHEWDAVIEVHLKGHFAPTRHAAAYWRERAKAGDEVRGRVINTSSPPASLATLAS